MNDDCIRQLTEIGFIFKEPLSVLDVMTGTGVRREFKAQIVPDVPFAIRLEQLQSFMAETEHLNIPPNLRRFNNLGGWACGMTKFYKHYKEWKQQFPLDLIAKFDQLIALGFVCDVSQLQTNRTWDDHLNELIKYKEQTGSARVPVKYKGNVWFVFPSPPAAHDDDEHHPESCLEME